MWKNKMVASATYGEILKIFSPKNWRFLFKLLLVSAKKFDHNIGVWEKMPIFFLRKLAKITTPAPGSEFRAPVAAMAGVGSV
jgi:hypothetical protein